MNHQAEAIERLGPRLYHRRLPTDEWVAVVDALNQKGALQYLYAEEPATIHLAAYRRPEAHWSYGRAFGEAMEVRWSQRRDGQVDLVLLTEVELAEPGWQPMPLAEDGLATLEAKVEDGGIMLLGVSRRHPKSPYGGDREAPDEWTESRTPRPLNYPVKTGDPPERWARVKAKIYYVNDRPVLTRMVKLEVTNDVKRL